MADKKIVRTLATNLTLDTDGAKDGLKQLTQAVKSANDEAKILEAQYKASGDAVQASKAKYDGLTTVVDQQKTKVDALKQALESNNTSTEAGQKNQAFLTAELAKAERQLGSYQGQLDKATTAYKYQESGLAELNKELKHGSDMTDAHARALEAEGKTAEAQEVRLKGLKETHQNLSKQLKIQQDELKDLANTGDKSSESYKKQELRVAQMGAKVSEASQDISKFTDKSKDVEGSAHGFTKVTGSIEGMGKAFVPVIAGVTALAGAFGAYINKVADTNSQISGIQARTTQTYAQAKESYKAVNDLYAKGYGESLDELQETYTRVQQLNPKDSISDLNEKTKLASTYAKQSGADIQEVLLGASKATTNLGISYEDYFDLMTTASKKGLDTQGALSDEMGEYSQVLGQMGFKAKDAFALLQNGLESGAYNSDKLLDFTKEFGISLTDGRMQDNIGAFSKNTQQMFNGFKQGKVTSAEMLTAVTGDLSGMTDKQKEATLASNLWSALGEDNALKVVESMGKANTSFDQVKGTAKATADQLKTSNPFELAKRGAEAFAGSLTINQDQLKKLKDASKPLMEALKELFEATVKALPQIAKDLTPIIDFTAKHLPEIITGLGILAGLWGTTKVLAFGKSVLGVGGELREMGKLAKGVGKGMWWTAKLVATTVWKTLALIGDAVILTGKAFKWTGNLAITGVKKGLSALTTAGKATGTALKKAVSVTASVATKGAQVALKALAVVGKSTGLALKGAFTFLKANPLGLLITGIALAVTALVGLYQHNKKFRDFVNSIIKAVVEMAKGIAQWFGDMWKTVANIFGKIGDFIGDTLGWIKKTWDKYWTTMSEFYSGIWKAIMSVGSSAIKGISNVIGDVLGSIGNVWRSVWGGLSEFFGGIWKGIKGLASDGVNGVLGIVNSLIDSLDAVWKFFTGKETNIHHLKPVKFAQGGIVTQRLAMVNDGAGANWKELLQLPDGQLMMSQKRNAVMPLPVGTRVYNGDETKEIMSSYGIEKYANGGIVGGAIDWAKGSLSNVGDWIGDKFEAIGKFLDSPLSAIKSLISKATSHLIAPLGNFGQMASGMFDKLTSPIADWFTKGLKKVQEESQDGGGGRGAPGGAGVERWRPQVIDALRANGLSTSREWQDMMLRQINSESGANERAVQGGYTDVNTLSGDLAKGLLQTISSTFNAYKFPGHGQIFNGYDNMLASFSYMKARYGSSIPAVIGHGHGYANGGLITKHQIAEIGEGNQPEMIIPLSGMKASRGYELLGKTMTAMAQRDGLAGNSQLSDSSEVTQLLSQNNQLLGAVTQLLGAILGETEKGNQPVDPLALNSLSRNLLGRTVRSTN